MNATGFGLLCNKLLDEGIWSEITPVCQFSMGNNLSSLGELPLLDSIVLESCQRPHDYRPGTGRQLALSQTLIVLICEDPPPHPNPIQSPLAYRQKKLSRKNHEFRLIHLPASAISTPPTLFFFGLYIFSHTPLGWETCWCIMWYIIPWCRRNTRGTWHASPTSWKLTCGSAHTWCSFVFSVDVCACKSCEKQTYQGVCFGLMAITSFVQDRAFD